jgi:hypothetical protein
MSISTALIYIVILIALGVAVTVTFSAADKYGLLDPRKEKSGNASHAAPCTPHPLSSGVENKIAEVDEADVVRTHRRRRQRREVRRPSAFR